MKRYPIPLWIPVWGLLVCLLLGGCDPESRARRNPLDPRNPVTEGRPQNLRSVAEHQRIMLTWTPIALTDLKGYLLRRSTVTGGAVAETDIFVSPEFSRYVDLQVVNGQTYEYSLSALVTPDTESLPSEPTVATPGPSSCWVADPGSGVIFRTSADARAIAVQVTGLSSPVAVSADPVDGGCWTTETISGILVRATAEGGLDVLVQGLLRPGKVAVDARDGACWVVEDGHPAGQTSAVTRVRRDGTIQFRIFAFTAPQAIAVDPTDGSVWVTDRANRQTAKMDETGRILFAAGGFETPVDVVADPADGGCWVIDEGTKQVVKLNSTGDPVGTVSGFVKPASGAYDNTQGSLWIADPGQQAVIKLLPGIPASYNISQQTGFHLTVAGLQRPVSVSVDTRTGDCWVADLDDLLVLKLGPDGQLLGGLQLPSGSRPFAVSVDPGTRHADAGP